MDFPSVQERMDRGLGPHATRLEKADHLTARIATARLMIEVLEGRAPPPGPIDGPARPIIPPTPESLASAAEYRAWLGEP